MPKPSIVFAHGLWADGSCFSKLIPTLLAEGYEVMASQHGLDSLATDVTAVKACLGRVHTPAILRDPRRPLLWRHSDHVRWNRRAGGRARLHRGPRTGCRRDLSEPARQISNDSGVRPHRGHGRPRLA